MNTKSSRVIVAIVALSLSVQASLADDWTRFRGPQGAGVSTDTNVPLKWSSTENLRWKADLPGPGSSSPIVLGDQVFVTCYSGYGDPKSDGGSIASLQRHLVCVARGSGKAFQ